MLRKIEEVYGDQITYKYIVGGLVRDIRQFRDQGNNIGGSNWYREVAAHWLEASGRHGMPVDERIFFDIKDEIFSTYPASIAFKAAQMQDKTLANRYLRRLREGAAAERLIIQQDAVQARLAEEVGLDSVRLLEAISNGRAREAFEEDMNICRKVRISGFPTFSVRRYSDGAEISLGGFMDYGRAAQMFHAIAGDELVERPTIANEENMHAFVAKHGKVAPRELEVVFDLNERACNKMVNKLESDRKIRKSAVGNGVFISLD